MSPSLLSEEVEGTEIFPQQHCIHPEHVLAVRRTVLSGGVAQQIAALFSILADPTRVQVVYALLNAPTGELCVCDLAAGLGRDDTTISHQLRVLRNRQLVTMRKVGRIVYYRLAETPIRQVLALGLLHIEEPLPAILQSSQEVMV